MRGSKKCYQRRQIDTFVVFWGPGTSLGTLLCLFKKFESSIKGGGGVHTRVHSLWTVKKITWVPN